MVTSAAAQPTGTLSEKRAADRNDRPFLTAALSSDEVRELAALLVDPSLTSPTRASVWAFSIAAREEGEEVMIQANLCDAVVLACNRANTAVTLALVGPLDKDKKPVELASLSGLTGSARLQAGFSRALIPKPKSTRRLAAQAKEFPLAILATIAQPTFGFREPATLTDHEPSYVTWGVTAQLSLKTTTWAALGSYAYEDTRKPNDPANICTPSSLGPPGTLACSSVTFGEPEREYKRIITGEVRRLIGNMAILHLLLSHDYNAGVTGVELPIYIIPKLQDGLGGGVRIGYRTDEKHLTAAIFVGVMKL